MDSQLTLIDARGSTPSEEYIVLTFNRDDMRNTRLRIRGLDQPSYFVDTRDNVTTVCTEECLLATITRRKLRPDQITFPGSKPVSLGSWLKAPKLWSLPLEFQACGRRFEWREDLLGRLMLRESGSPGDTLAWFSKSRRDVWDHMMHPAYLAIKPEMVEMKDTIVLSCLLAEHKLRTLAATQGKTFLDTMSYGF